MALGTTTAALLTTLGIAGAGAGAARLTAPRQQKTDSAPMPLPQPPSVDSSSAKADDVVRKKKIAMSQSVYTSPLGVSGNAQIARKTLLGQ